MPEEGKELHSFELIFQQNYQRLCRHVFRMTRDMEAAEDLVQEVFVSFWKEERFQSVSQPESYLYRACLNKALNYTSSQKRKREIQELHFREQSGGKSGDPQQELEQQELEARVQESIEKLPPMCRKVFLLSRYEEMSHKEIAAFLQISPNTVDNHIKKALAILRKALLCLFLMLLKFF